MPLNAASSGNQWSQQTSDRSSIEKTNMVKMLDPLGLLNSFDCTGPTWVHPTGLPMAHAMRSLRHRHPAGPNRLLRCCSIDGFDNQQLKSLEAVVVNHEYRQLKSFI